MKKYLYILFLTLASSATIFGQGSTCATADPFCTALPITFPNSTNTTAEIGPDYGCLGSQPNPAWYYMQVGTAGNIVIDISQQSAGGSGLDVDFALWGPANTLGTLCATNTNSPLDCSFSAAANETATIPNGQIGEYYILVLTNYSNSAGDISFSQTGGTGSTSCSPVLPIKLLSFNAECNKNNIELTWSTASEINNDYFTVEKSEDGINYEIVATINGSGNSSAIKHYSYNDIGKERYYRLKQTDFNGEYEYFQPIAVSCKNSPIFEIYPNPFKNKLRISISRKGNYSLEIVNHLGQPILQQQIGNELTESIDISQIMGQGMYFATLRDDSGKIILVEKIFKQ